MTPKKINPLDEIKLNLFSEDEHVQLAALNKIREIGDNSIIQPMMKLYSITPFFSVQQEIGSILGSVKNPGADQVFMDLLDNKEFASHRSDILSFMWNSAMVPLEGIVRIVEIAIEGNYHTTLEALTLVENFEEPLAEDTILEVISLLQTEINSSQDKDKVILLTDMMMWFRNLEERNLM
jgi:hypothetical protein